MALEHGDLGPGRSALDLGCGTGMLTTGCALVECDFVVGVDCDAHALSIAQENIMDLELEDRVSFLLARVEGGMNNDKTQRSSRSTRNQGRGGRKGNNRHVAGHGRATNKKVEQQQVTYLEDGGLPLQGNCVDTVLTNPPFGTKHNAGMDIQFLRAATYLARRTVYSFHKTSTREFLTKTVTGWGMEIDVVAQMKFDLPKTYKFHKQATVDVEVDLIRVQVSDGLEKSSVPR